MEKLNIYLSWILLCCSIGSAYTYSSNMDICDNDGTNIDYNNFDCNYDVDQAYEVAEFWSYIKWVCTPGGGNQDAQWVFDWAVNSTDPSLLSHYFTLCGVQGETSSNCGSDYQSVDCNAYDGYWWSYASCIPAFSIYWDNHQRDIESKMDIYDEVASAWIGGGEGSHGSISQMTQESLGGDFTVISWLDNISKYNTLTAGSVNSGMMAGLISSLSGFDTGNYTEQLSLAKDICYFNSPIEALCSYSNTPQWYSLPQDITSSFNDRVENCSMTNTGSTMTLNILKNTYIDNNKLVLFYVSKAGLEQGKGGEGTGASWSSATCTGQTHWVAGIGYNSTDIMIWHPINGFQVWTNTEFSNNLLAGYIYYDCTFDVQMKTSEGDNTWCVRETETLSYDTATYETDGIYDPSLFCHDSDGDDDYDHCYTEFPDYWSGFEECETICEMECTDEFPCDSGDLTSTTDIILNTSGTYTLKFLMSTRLNETNLSDTDTLSITILDPDYDATLYLCGGTCGSDDFDFDGTVTLGENNGIALSSVDNSNCDGFYARESTACWEFNGSHAGYDLCTSLYDGCRNSCPEATYKNQSYWRAINVTFDINYSKNVYASVNSYYGDYFDLSNQINLSWEYNVVIADISSLSDDSDYNDDFNVLVGGKIGLSAKDSYSLGSAPGNLIDEICWDIDNDDDWDYIVSQTGEHYSGRCVPYDDFVHHISMNWSEYTINFTEVIPKVRTIKLKVSSSGSNSSDDDSITVNWLNDNTTASLNMFRNSNNNTKLNLTKNTEGFYLWNLNTSSTFEPVQYSCSMVLTPSPLDDFYDYKYCYKLVTAGNTDFCDWCGVSDWVISSDPINEIINISYMFGNFTGDYNDSFYHTAQYTIFSLIGVDNLSGAADTETFYFNGICGDGEWDGSEEWLDYGKECGTCFDGIYNPLIGEYSTDYGGVNCGYCTQEPTNPTFDTIWSIVDDQKKSQFLERDHKFNKNYICDEGVAIINGPPQMAFGFGVVIVVMILGFSGFILLFWLFGWKLPFIMVIGLLKSRKKDNSDKNRNV